MDIAIIGAGIGGLTLALALRSQGVQAQVFEQADHLTEIGAAVALSANATRELRRLGLIDDLMRSGLEPSELIYRDGESGERISAYDVRIGDRYQARFGAPYLGIHRADLQKVLGSAVGVDNISLGSRLVSVEEHAGRARLHFARGEAREVDLVVGADGVRSAVRSWVTGGVQPRYSGTSAFRGIVPVSALPTLPDPQAIQFWMGPDAHLLHYAIGAQGDHVNFFAVTEGPRAWPGGQNWAVESSAEEAVAAFAGWHPAVTEMVRAGWVEKRWGLFVTPPLRRWHRGPAVLLGDAAHAMLPHHGQGANTTIEDAATLAGQLVGIRPDNREERLAAYEARRRPRTRLIQRSSWAANGALHATAEAAILERRRIVSRFPERFGWIHGFDTAAPAAPRPLRT